MGKDKKYKVVRFVKDSMSNKKEFLFFITSLITTITFLWSQILWAAGILPFPIKESEKTQKIFALDAQKTSAENSCANSIKSSKKPLILALNTLKMPPKINTGLGHNDDLGRMTGYTEILNQFGFTDATQANILFGSAKLWENVANVNADLLKTTTTTKRSEITYNGLNQITSYTDNITNPDGTKEIVEMYNMTYKPTGELNGYTQTSTEYENQYDEQGNVVGSKAKESQTTKIDRTTYDALGRVVSKTGTIDGEDYSYEVRAFDAVGRPVQYIETQGDAEIVHFGILFDSLGRVSEEYVKVSAESGGLFKSEDKSLTQYKYEYDQYGNRDTSYENEIYHETSTNIWGTIFQAVIGAITAVLTAGMTLWAMAAWMAASTFVSTLIITGDIKQALIGAAIAFVTVVVTRFISDIIQKAVQAGVQTAVQASRVATQTVAGTATGAATETVASGIGAGVGEGVGIGAGAAGVTIGAGTAQATATGIIEGATRPLLSIGNIFKESLKRIVTGVVYDKLREKGPAWMAYLASAVSGWVMDAALPLSQQMYQNGQWVDTLQIQTPDGIKSISVDQYMAKSFADRLSERINVQSVLGEMIGMGINYYIDDAVQNGSINPYLAQLLRPLASQLGQSIIGGISQYMQQLDQINKAMDFQRQGYNVTLQLNQDGLIIGMDLSKFDPILNITDHYDVTGKPTYSEQELQKGNEKYRILSTGIDDVTVFLQDSETGEYSTIFRGKGLFNDIQIFTDQSGNPMRFVSLLQPDGTITYIDPNNIPVFSALSDGRIRTYNDKGIAEGIIAKGATARWNNGGSFRDSFIEHENYTTYYNKNGIEKGQIIKGYTAVEAEDRIMGQKRYIKDNEYIMRDRNGEFINIVTVMDNAIVADNFKWKEIYKKGSNTLAGIAPSCAVLRWNEDGTFRDSFVEEDNWTIYYNKLGNEKGRILKGYTAVERGDQIYGQTRNLKDKDNSYIFRNESGRFVNVITITEDGGIIQNEGEWLTKYNGANIREWIRADFENSDKIYFDADGKNITKILSTQVNESKLTEGYTITDLKTGNFRVYNEKGELQAYYQPRKDAQGNIYGYRVKDVITDTQTIYDKDGNIHSTLTKEGKYNTYIDGEIYRVLRRESVAIVEGQVLDRDPTTGMYSLYTDLGDKIIDDPIGVAVNLNATPSDLPKEIAKEIIDNAKFWDQILKGELASKGKYYSIGPSKSERVMMAIEHYIAERVIDALQVFEVGGKIVFGPKGEFNLLGSKVEVGGGLEQEYTFGGTELYGSETKLKGGVSVEVIGSVRIVDLEGGIKTKNIGFIPFSGEFKGYGEESSGLSKSNVDVDIVNFDWEQGQHITRDDNEVGFGLTIPIPYTGGAISLGAKLAVLGDELYDAVSSIGIYDTKGDDYSNLMKYYKFKSWLRERVNSFFSSEDKYAEQAINYSPVNSTGDITSSNDLGGESPYVKKSLWDKVTDMAGTLKDKTISLAKTGLDKWSDFVTPDYSDNTSFWANLGKEIFAGEPINNAYGFYKDIYLDQAYLIGDFWAPGNKPEGFDKNAWGMWEDIVTPDYSDEASFASNFGKELFASNPFKTAAKFYWDNWSNLVTPDYSNETSLVSNFGKEIFAGHPIENAKDFYLEQAYLIGDFWTPGHVPEGMNKNAWGMWEDLVTPDYSDNTSFLTNFGKELFVENPFKTAGKFYLDNWANLVTPDYSDNTSILANFGKEIFAGEPIENAAEFYWNKWGDSWAVLFPYDASGWNPGVKETTRIISIPGIIGLIPELKVESFLINQKETIKQQTGKDIVVIVPFFEHSLLSQLPLPSMTKSFWAGVKDIGLWLADKALNVDILTNEIKVKLDKVFGELSPESIKKGITLQLYSGAFDTTLEVLNERNYPVKVVVALGPPSLRGGAFGTGEITNPYMERIVNIWGENDGLKYFLGAVGYKKYTGVEVINIKILGADHEDYLNNSMNQDQTSVSYKASAFVNRITVKAYDRILLLDYLNNTPAISYDPIRDLYIVDLNKLYPENYR